MEETKKTGKMATTKKPTGTKKNDQSVNVVSSAMTLLSAAINKGIDAEGIKTLVELRAAEEARAAEKEFARHFHALQGDLPVIKKNDNAYDSSGNKMFSYAPLDYIEKACRTTIRKHGFSYYWNEKIDGEGKLVTLVIYGYEHSREVSFYSPFFEQNKMMKKAQAAAAATTFARRHTFVMGFGVQVESEDLDAAMLTYEDVANYADDAIALRSCDTVDALVSLWKDTKPKYNGDKKAIDALINIYTAKKAELESRVSDEPAI